MKVSPNRRSWPAALGRALVRALPLLPPLAIWLLAASTVAADSEGALKAPTFGDVVAWSFDPTVQIPLLLTAAAWLWAIRHVNAAHPANPVPPLRTVSFLAGLAVIEVALQSAIGTYDDVLFSVHMVQHVLLTMVAAPLLVLGAPITLLLRVARPEDRKRWILPVLHSRIVRALSFPVVAWVLFAGAMWGTHFSPIFELALESQPVHDLEHVLYLGTAVLFWWPAIGVDPSPWRMSHPARLLYVFLQMPQNSFLGLAIYSASTPLYAHYASLTAGWLPSALSDQQLAGGLMWVSGDLLFLVEVLLLVARWMRDEERRTTREEARLDAIDAAALAKQAPSDRPRPEPLASRVAFALERGQRVAGAEVGSAVEAVSGSDDAR